MMMVGGEPCECADYYFPSDALHYSYRVARFLFRFFFALQGATGEANEEAGHQA